MQKTMVKRIRRKGAALVYIIVIFAFVASATAVLAGLFNHNFRQAYHQQKQQQAYYIALSGIELGTTALLKEDTTTLTTWYSEFKNNATISVGYQTSPQEITVGEGKATVQISKVKVKNEDWVKVHSVGSIKDMYGKEVKVVAELLISVMNEQLVEWKTSFPSS